MNSFYNALPAYLGGKRRLVPLIFGFLNQVLPSSEWSGTGLLDPMCGGGAVALAAKARGFNVCAGDSAERGAVVSRALIENSSVRIRPEDVYHLLPLAKRHIIDEPVDWLDLFSSPNALSEPKRSLMQLVLIKAYLRSFPMSMPSASDAHSFVEGDYDRISPRRISTYFRGVSSLKPEVLWRIAGQVNSGVFGGDGQALRGDALRVIASSDADVLYLDPPYTGTTNYGSTYARLDQLLGDPFTDSNLPDLDRLLESASDIPLLILSYGGPGVTAEGIAARISAHRRVINCVDVPYPHLVAVATRARKEATREVIVIAENR